MMAATKWPTGYKVCEPIGIGTFRPATSLGDTSVRYWLGQETRPTESGPCALFGTRERAREWAWGYTVGVPDGYVILEVRYKKSRKVRLWRRRWDGTREFRPFSSLPHGTILADAVLPLRQVYPEVKGGE